MLEALRGLGYSPATALADIIDNSIAAGASNVELDFVWNGAASYIAVMDDGSGMDDETLERAMRLGETCPLDQRSSNDLGRFGLGLKTASFSQCRRLTVASRTNGQTQCLRWDLDVLAASEDDGWHLLEGAAKGSDILLSPLEQRDKGTLVLWECMDRIVTRGFGEQAFLDLIDAVERHLALVFHRYLDGPNPALRLAINGRDVRPWDPFMTNHSATWTSPEIALPAPWRSVTVRCHVLPHQDWLTQAEHDQAGGPAGWTAQQGFYIYRNKRLLVAGSWLGLGTPRGWTKEEAHRLARIKLDIPNSADSDWKIDIRKSRARPPVEVRGALLRLAEDTRSRARRVFAHRGRPVRAGGAVPVAQAWRVERFKGGLRYRIDRAHAAIKSVLDDAGDAAPQVKAMLRVIEETVPVQRIWLDTTETCETPRTGFAGEPSEEVGAVLAVLFSNLVRKKGLSTARAREQLLNTEPFHNYPELVAALPDEL